MTYIILLLHCCYNDNKCFYFYVVQNMSCTAPIVPTKILGDAEELDRHLVQHGYPEVGTYTPDYFFQNISNVKILK